MPITGPASYPSVTREFLEHWKQADAALGSPGAIILSGGVAAADLAELLEALDAARDSVSDAGIDRTLAREQLNGTIAGLQGRMVEFNGRVRADFSGSAFERTLPKAFALGDAESGVREGLRQVSRLWTRIDGVAPAPAGVALPFLLREGYGRAKFDADREVLRERYAALSDAEVDLRLARERRNDLQEDIYEALKAYRLKLPTLFPPGHALAASLPSITSEQGHTPDPVDARVSWDAAAGRAEITWTESGDAALKGYEVRGVPGGSYGAEDEAVLAFIPAGAERRLATDFALGSPGLTAGFRVYVQLLTGNERGSEAVHVTRPA